MNMSLSRCLTTQDICECYVGVDVAVCMGLGLSHSVCVRMCVAGVCLGCVLKGGQSSVRVICHR